MTSALSFPSTASTVTIRRERHTRDNSGNSRPAFLMKSSPISWRPSILPVPIRAILSARFERMVALLLGQTTKIPQAMLLSLMPFASAQSASHKSLPRFRPRLTWTSTDFPVFVFNEISSPGPPVSASIKTGTPLKTSSIQLTFCSRRRDVIAIAATRAW